MAASVLAVAEAIKTQLSTISGLRTFSYQPEQLNPPLAYPELNQVNYHRAMGLGDVVMDWTIHVIVGRYTDRTAYATLDAYLNASGSTSVRAALEADPTLGSVVQAVLLSSAADVTSLSEADAQFLEIQYQLTVHA
jgi:hypothetical protein